jgi:protein-S-isoprenylcysteine O-methyltransferase Ste14
MAISEQDPPGVIAPPPLIYLAGLGLGFAIGAVLPSTTLPAAVSWPVGAALSVAGFLMARAFFRTLHRAHTPVDPYRTPSALVTTGPYRLTRNPGYVAMALGFAGVAVLVGNLWILAPLPAVLLVVDRGVIVREERCLERLFGAQYAEYRARTRRWL